MNLTVLDCTLRDGGYYNNWDFDQQTVHDYINSVVESGIDVVEVGFRFTPKNEFLGAHAYTTDAYLETLDIADSIIVGVMCNASDLVNYPTGPRDAIDSMFKESAQSPVELVRIASHFTEVEECQPAVQRLKELGYTVGFNLMQVGGRNRESLIEIAGIVADWNSVDVFYFADSLGNMDAQSVKFTIDAFREKWDGPLGIHTHDNMGNALSNTKAARDAGANWLDATICGMGRGPGNTRMEYLLLDLERSGLKKYNSQALFSIAAGDFQQLMDKYGWGSNLLYFLSATHKIHPTYVQEMLKVKDYNAEQAINALKQLSETDSISYNQEQLQQALQLGHGSYTGTWSNDRWAEGKTILILGSGDWIQNHTEILIDFIDTANPIVISLNTNSPLPEEKISAYAACHLLRFAMEGQHYLELKKPLIAPKVALPEKIQQEIGTDRHFDYGMTINPGTFIAETSGCTIPQQLAVAYTMAFANSTGAAKILMAGFDGYESDDPRQSIMTSFLNLYQKQSKNIPLLAITPTNYPVPQSSIYALTEKS